MAKPMTKFCFACGDNNPKKLVNLNRDAEDNRLCVRCYSHIIRRGGRHKGDNLRGKKQLHIDNRMEKNGMWKGGRAKTEGGYILIKCGGHPRTSKDGYVREHVLVMEKHLGRYLTSKEIVHHENEITNDNRIENLRLFSTDNEHIRYHRLKDIQKGIQLFGKIPRGKSSPSKGKD